MRRSPCLNLSAQSPQRLVQRARDPEPLQGERLVQALADRRRGARVLTLQRSRQALELYDVYQQRIHRGDDQIQQHLRPLQEASDPPAVPLPQTGRKPRRSGKEPDLDLRSPLFALCGGVDLSELPGIGPYGALKLVSEICLDMRRWASGKRFVAWLTLAPRTEITGGKLLRSHTQPSANRAAKLLRMPAMSLGRSDHALGAFYRRLRPHRQGQGHHRHGAQARPPRLPQA